MANPLMPGMSEHSKTRRSDEPAAAARNRVRAASLRELRSHERARRERLATRVSALLAARRGRLAR
jgi:hypothetical protein